MRFLKIRIGNFWGKKNSKIKIIILGMEEVGGGPTEREIMVPQMAMDRVFMIEEYTNELIN